MDHSAYRGLFARSARNSGLGAAMPGQDDAVLVEELGTTDESDHQGAPSREHQGVGSGNRRGLSSSVGAGAGLGPSGANQRGPASGSGSGRGITDAGTSSIASIQPSVAFNSGYNAMVQNLHAFHNYPRSLLALCSEQQLARLLDSVPLNDSGPVGQYNSTGRTSSGGRTWGSMGTANRGASGSITAPSPSASSEFLRVPTEYSPSQDVKRMIKFISDRTGASPEKLSDEISFAQFLQEARRAIDIQLNNPVAISTPNWTSASGRRSASDSWPKPRQQGQGKGQRPEGVERFPMGPNSSFKPNTGQVRGNGIGFGAAGEHGDMQRGQFYPPYHGHGDVGHGADGFHRGPMYKQAGRLRRSSSFDEYRSPGFQRAAEAGVNPPMREFGSRFPGAQRGRRLSAQTNQDGAPRRDAHPDAAVAGGMRHGRAPYPAEQDHPSQAKLSQPPVGERGPDRGHGDYVMERRPDQVPYPGVAGPWASSLLGDYEEPDRMRAAQARRNRMEVADHRASPILNHRVDTAAGDRRGGRAGERFKSRRGNSEWDLCKGLDNEDLDVPEIPTQMRSEAEVLMDEPHPAQTAPNYVSPPPSPPPSPSNGPPMSGGPMPGAMPGNGMMMHPMLPPSRHGPPHGMHPMSNVPPMHMGAMGISPARRGGSGSIPSGSNEQDIERHLIELDRSGRTPNPEERMLLRRRDEKRRLIAEREAQIRMEREHRIQMDRELEEYRSQQNWQRQQQSHFRPPSRFVSRQQTTQNSQDGDFGVMGGGAGGGNAPMFRDPDGIGDSGLSPQRMTPRNGMFGRPGPPGMAHPRMAGSDQDMYASRRSGMVNPMAPMYPHPHRNMPTYHHPAMAPGLRPGPPFARPGPHQAFSGSESS